MRAQGLAGWPGDGSCNLGGQGIENDSQWVRASLSVGLTYIIAASWFLICTVAVWGRIFHILRRWLLEYQKCSHILATSGDLEWKGSGGEGRGLRTNMFTAVEALVAPRGSNPGAITLTCCTFTPRLSKCLGKNLGPLSLRLRWGQAPPRPSSRGRARMQPLQQPLGYPGDA